MERLFSSVLICSTLIDFIVKNKPTELNLKNPDSWKTVQQVKKFVRYAIDELPEDEKFHLPNTIQQTTPLISNHLLQDHHAPLYTTPKSLPKPDFDGVTMLVDLRTILDHFNEKIGIDLPLFVTLFRLNVFRNAHLGHSDVGPPTTAASQLRGDERQRRVSWFRLWNLRRGWTHSHA
jgi:hypothetical protein